MELGWSGGRDRRRARRALVPLERPKVPQVYLARPHRKLHDVYLGDPTEGLQGSRFKWFVSTCIAATVGLAAIGIVIFGSHDAEEPGSIGVQQTAETRSVWERVWDLQKLRPVLPHQRREAQDPSPAAVKSDRLQTAAGGITMRHIVHDSYRKREGGRERVLIKPYARVVGRLSTSSQAHAAAIPPFNPFRLYANLDPIEDGQDGPQGRTAAETDAAIKVVELLGGFLPEEDGQELEAEEVSALVARTSEDAANPTMRQAYAPEGSDQGAAARATAAAPTVAAAPPLTTVLTKRLIEPDEDLDTEGLETRIIKVAQGETLMSILRKVGAEIWQARAIMDVANASFPVAQLKEGDEIRLALAPSPTSVKRLVPVRVAIYSEAHQHRVTVTRGATGEYVSASGNVDVETGGSGRDGESEQAVSLYASFYRSALSQRIAPEVIEQILRINAYDIDFKRRARPGDGFELFFDLKDDDASGDGALGDLLFTAFSAAGETKRFYRFRTPDNAVEYYDEQGQNSKKFLMRKPVRGEEARLTSGFGMRLHPVFRVPRMHTGIDWSAPPGTPILAAGSGIIEDAGRNAGYGHYVRIRHANGYKTAYGHMSRYAPGVQEGVSVRQGQIIGYVGSTGVASGPHLHFEILVNNNFVDPMRIHVPRERRLSGRELAEFHKERARIDEMMRRPPVSTGVSTEEPVAAKASAPASISTSSVLRAVGK